MLLHDKGGIQVEAIRRYNLQFTTPPPPNKNQETLIQMKTVNVLLFKAHTSSEHPTVVTTAAVRYERVMIGICLYHSSTPCAILISPPPQAKFNQRNRRGTLEPDGKIYGSFLRIAMSFSDSKTLKLKLRNSFSSYLYYIPSYRK